MKLYVISPPQIHDLQHFCTKITKIFQHKNKPSIFQLRLKNVSDSTIIAAIETTLPICMEYNVPFILNDDINLATKYGVGAHVGENDDNISEIMRFIESGNIFGASCYGDLQRAKFYANLGASYISFGAFYETKTKIVKAHPDLSIIHEFKKEFQTPVCAIGGINASNIHNVESAGADYAAIISAAWNANEISIY